jgi:hypothetical protein
MVAWARRRANAAIAQPFEHTFWTSSWLDPPMAALDDLRTMKLFTTKLFVPHANMGNFDRLWRRRFIASDRSKQEARRCNA